MDYYTLMYGRGYRHSPHRSKNKLDLEAGINQNLLQQYSLLEFLAEMFTSNLLVDRKRYRAEWDEKFSTLPTCGIVTTGKSWLLNKMETVNGVRHIYCSSTVELTLNSKQILGSTSNVSQQFLTMQQVVTLLNMIIGFIFAQMKAVEENAALESSIGCKRIKAEDLLENEISWANCVVQKALTRKLISF